MIGPRAAPLLALALVLGCGSSSNDDEAPPIGSGIALIDAAPALPSACREFAGTGPERRLQTGPRTWLLRGDELVADVDADDGTLVIGVVADGHGGQADTLANLAAARTEFRSAGVELVLALGGMGADHQELGKALGAIADPGWLLLAMPGDRESISELKTATESLGETVIDGSQIRLLRGDGTAIGLLPGSFEAAQQPAGATGCLSTAEDARALMVRLANFDGQRAIASYVPPRQRGLGASDRTRDGIHVGRRDLASAIADAELALVLSAMVDDSALGPIAGNASPRRRSHLAAGSIDASEVATAPRPAGYPQESLVPPPGRGTALIVRISVKQLQWRRLDFRSGALQSR